jgi:hypothetical protein
MYVCVVVRKEQHSRTDQRHPKSGRSEGGGVWTVDDKPCEGGVEHCGTGMQWKEWMELMEK